MRHAPFLANLSCHKRSKEQLLSILQLVEKPKAAANMREENGQLIWADIPAAYFAERKEFLLRLLNAINNKCELAPAFGPAKLNKVLRLLPQILDSVSLDAIYLSLEHSAQLVSEDAALRMLATEAGVDGVACIQSLLMNLRDDNLLKRDDYSKIVLSKLAFGHDFVSVDSHDLHWAANAVNGQHANLFKTALDSFRRPTINLQSAVLVCVDFLRAAAHEMSAKLVAQHYRDCLEVLADGRDAIKDRIAQALRKGMNIVLDHLPSPKAVALRKELDELLREPPIAIPRLKPLVVAIQRALETIN